MSQSCTWPSGSSCNSGLGGSRQTSLQILVLLVFCHNKSFMECWQTSFYLHRCIIYYISLNFAQDQGGIQNIGGEWWGAYLGNSGTCTCQPHNHSWTILLIGISHARWMLSGCRDLPASWGQGFWGPVFYGQWSLTCISLTILLRSKQVLSGGWQTLLQGICWTKVAWSALSDLSKLQATVEQLPDNGIHQQKHWMCLW